MKEKIRCNFEAVAFILVMILVFAGQVVQADDLTGSTRFLCAAVQATACQEDGECANSLPQGLNIPEFIEVDLEAKRLSTTPASALNRATAIAHISREGGTIVLQGFELGRAFSWVIAEPTGQATVAIATEGSAVIVFGSCTPLTPAADSK
jgi:hypothetical protein